MNGALGHRLYSLAVEGLDLEIISIEVYLVPKEAEFFVEQHIQNPPKTVLGEFFYSRSHHPKCD